MGHEQELERNCCFVRAFWQVSATNPSSWSFGFFFASNYHNIGFLYCLCNKKSGNCLHSAVGIAETCCPTLPEPLACFSGSNVLTGRLIAPFYFFVFLFVPFCDNPFSRSRDLSREPRTGFLLLQKLAPVQHTRVWFQLMHT